MKVLNKTWTIYVILNTIFVSASYRIYSAIRVNYLTMRMIMKFLCYMLLIVFSFLSFSQRGLALVVEKENKKKTSALNKSEEGSDLTNEAIKAQDLIPEGKELINMDFPEPTEIKDIIRAVSLWTGKNIILDRNVSGTVQIISPKKVTKEEAYETFLSALNALDYTVVQTGSVMKVMKKRAALRSNLATYWGNKWAPRTDKVITQIIPLKYVDARKIQLTLQKVVSAQSIVAYEPTNTIIISDSGYQVRRVIEILDQLDVQTQQPKMVMVPIKYSEPKVIQRKVTEILRGTSGRVSQNSYHSFKILTDERTNSIIIFGPPRSIKDVKDLVKKFDINVEDHKPQATVHVRPLDYADARKIAATLSSLASAQKRSKSKGFQRTKFTSPGSKVTSLSSLGEDVKITADEATNSLIITGSRAAYDALNLIIKKLDIRRSQVFIEADILDINVGDAFHMGLSLFAGAKGGGKEPTTVIGAWEGKGMGDLMQAMIMQNQSDSKTLGTDVIAKVANSFANNFSVGILLGKTQNIPGIGEFSPGALINILKSDSNSRLLSSPQMLTSNNQEASITVGEKRLFQTQSMNSTTGAIATTVEKIDVDLSLSVKPNISYSNYVTLDIKLNSSYVSSVVNGIPQIAKRKSNQLVTVKDGQTVVISGLFQASEHESYKKVPILGDIPVIGVFFRKTDITKTKNNLVVFITPHVVHGAADLAAIYKSKIKDRDQFLENIYGSDYKEQEYYKIIPDLDSGSYKPTSVDNAEEKRRVDSRKEALKAMGYGDKNNGKVKKSRSPLKKEIEQYVPVEIDSGKGTSSPPTKEKSKD
jgi:general secretion pathway protein D